MYDNNNGVDHYQLNNYAKLHTCKHFFNFQERQLILSTELLQNIVLTAFCQTCFHARINFSWKCRNRFVDDAELIQYFAF